MIFLKPIDSLFSCISNYNPKDWKPRGNVKTDEYKPLNTLCVENKQSTPH